MGEFFQEIKKSTPEKEFRFISHNNKMEDDELKAIRAQRMAQMQGQAGGQGGGDAANQQKAAQDRRAQVEDMKNSILSQVLSQEARARLNTLMIAKPEKGQQVEAAIIQMAQSGQLGGKLSEDELIGLLERFAGSTKKSTVKFDRRRNALDSDDDDDF